MNWISTRYYQYRQIDFVGDLYEAAFICWLQVQFNALNAITVELCGARCDWDNPMILGEQDWDGRNTAALMRNYQQALVVSVWGF